MTHDSSLYCSLANVLKLTRIIVYKSQILKFHQYIGNLFLNSLQNKDDQIVQ